MSKNSFNPTLNPEIIVELIIDSLSHSSIAPKKLSSFCDSLWQSLDNESALDYPNKYDQVFL